MTIECSKKKLKYVPFSTVFLSSPDEKYIEERYTFNSDILKYMNPAKIFEHLFDDEVLEVIPMQSTIYAGQNDKHDTFL